MKNALYLFLFCVLLLSCAPSKYINVFENSSLAGKFSAGEYNEQRDLAFAKCRLEALKIPIPAPRCESFIESCESNKETNVKCNTREICDYTAVDAARAAQKETQVLCMKVDGWETIRKVNPKWIEWQQSK